MSGIGARRLAPAYTPLSLAALAGAAFAGVAAGEDPRDALRLALRDRFAADDVLLTSSGTHALEIAIRIAAGEGRDDAIVALPAYTCYDIATAAVGAGLRIALYDVDPATLSPDLASLERALAAGAHVAVVSPLYGIPVDWDAIERCAAPHGAVVIEDAAQGHGASWSRRRLGSLAAISILSFGRGKGWTGGCGGAVLVRRGATLRIAGAPPMLAAPSPFAGMLGAAGQWALSGPSLFGLAAAMPWLHLGETHYRDPDLPRGMPRSAAALLLRTGELADEEGAARRRNGDAMHATVTAQARAGRMTVIQRPAAGEPGYLRFAVCLSGGASALAGAERARELGMASAYPTTLAALKAVRDRAVGFDEQSAWPGAEALVRDLVTLPTHSMVTQREREELLALVL